MLPLDLVLQIEVSSILIEKTVLLIIVEKRFINNLMDQFYF